MLHVEMGGLCAEQQVMSGVKQTPLRGHTRNRRRDADATVAGKW
jgi:hypothetical protein